MSSQLNWTAVSNSFSRIFSYEGTVRADSLSKVRLILLVGPIKVQTESAVLMPDEGFEKRGQLSGPDEQDRGDWR